jgi:hypothetical protein
MIEDVSYLEFTKHEITCRALVIFDDLLILTSKSNPEVCKLGIFFQYIASILNIHVVVHTRV